MNELLLPWLRYLLLAFLALFLFQISRPNRAASWIEGAPYLSGTIVGAGAIALVHAARYTGWPILPLLYGGAAVLGFPIVSALLRRGGFQGDHLVLPVVAVLSGLGLAEIYRLQPELLFRQATWFYLGFAVLLWTLHAARDPSWLARYRYLSALVGLLLLIAALLFGVDRGGTRQWIAVGPFSLQPSEIVKVLVVLFFAAYLAEFAPLRGDQRVPRLLELRALAPLLAVLALSLILLVVQGDIGAASLYFGVVLIMIYAATGRTAYAVAGALTFVGAAAAAYAALPHVHLRVDAWVNPWQDAAGSGYQVLQALFALGSGGLLGTGPGLGHPELVPAAHTDLIFAAIGEELGYAGALAVIALYLVLLLRGMRIAREAQSAFARLLALGATAVLGVQSAIILGGSIRMFPLTGITLPFMSYGGSSVVSNFLLLGLLLAASDEEGRRGAAPS